MESKTYPKSQGEGKALISEASILGNFHENSDEEGEPETVLPLDKEIKAIRYRTQREHYNAVSLSIAATWLPRGEHPRKALSGSEPDSYRPWRYQVDRKIHTDYPLYPTERSRLDYALSQMEEPIFSVMLGWIIDEAEITYQDFMSEVEHYMGLHLQKREARRELLTIKQRQDEGVTEYYHRIRAIWQKAKTLEDERVEKFLTTILPQLSFSLLGKTYTNVRDVLDDARKVEDRKKDIQSLKNRKGGTEDTPTTRRISSTARVWPSTRASHTTSADSTTTSCTIAVAGRNSRFGPVAKKPEGWTGVWYNPIRTPKKMDAVEKAQMVQQGRCWNCRGSGHRGADSCCPKFRGHS
jgi:Retrotransposon gag protein